jgi:hypothetical protein
MVYWAARTDVKVGAHRALLSRKELGEHTAVLGNPTVVAGVGVTHLRYPVHTS